MTNAIGRLRAADGCYVCELGDGAAILDTRADKYFTLNAVGRFIWEQLAQPATQDEIIAKTVGAFDVSEERCRQDVDRLLESLRLQSLVEPA
ncbi:PqqD family protein [Pseudoroseicyclus tamaricis]|uniref:PqqD family protein n=1 Tax=Pseudoroseicyclus tamaricis TaxID=2705421 RepID=A0A6B2JTQ5_9RHOB|nr:PqqD family protein [Pseudoroseicyclus tamaricis]NDV01345.1 PqqD family protein [Pseudoroseicyclus tamaricis]